VVGERRGRRCSGMSATRRHLSRWDVGFARCARFGMEAAKEFYEAMKERSIQFVEVVAAVCPEGQ